MGVNVAARLESLADPGGICISHTVHDQIKNKLALNYEDLGAQTVKNIVEPVRVFRVMLEGEAATRTTAKAKERSLRKRWRGGVFSLAGLTLIAAVVVFVQHLFSLRPPTTTASIPPAQGLTLPDKPSIAVLPFTNMSGDSEQEYFSDGMTEDLITALSRLPDLFVIARTSTFTYKGKAAKVQDISRELGVAYVLEGSVRKADNQVRITAQLVDATTGDHLWAEHYDRPLKDIFLLQDEIVRRIATTLNLQLNLREEHWFSVTKGTENLEAYDDFLRALEYLLRYTKDGDEKARQMLQKAITLDPKYADAYAWLSTDYLADLVLQWSRDPRLPELIRQAAEQAIALDDSNAEAYAMLSVAYLFPSRDYDKSITTAEHAVAIDPNFAQGYAYLAYALEVSGRPEEALERAEKAIRLDPWNKFFLFYKALAYHIMGRYGEAVPVYKEFLSYYPNFVAARHPLAACYVELGRMDEARAEAAEVVRINPAFSLEKQKQLSVIAQPMRDRLYGDAAKAGLK
jgi:adenylate cyclase